MSAKNAKSSSSVHTKAEDEEPPYPTKERCIEMWNKLLETEWFTSRPPEVQRLIRKYPFWKFYQRKKFDTKNPVRIWGVAEKKSGEFSLHATTAHLLFVNDTLNGLEEDDVEEVDAWNFIQSAFIASLQPEVRHAFLNPFGFAALQHESRAQVCDCCHTCSNCSKKK